MIKTIAEKIVTAWENYSAGVAILAIIGIIIGALAWDFGIMCLNALFIMLLWNWIMVGLFSAPALGFWTAFGLRLLCLLLIKSGVLVDEKSE